MREPDAPPGELIHRGHDADVLRRQLPRPAAAAAVRRRTLRGPRPRNEHARS